MLFRWKKEDCRYSIWISKLMSQLFVMLRKLQRQQLELSSGSSPLEASRKGFGNCSNRCRYIQCSEMNEYDWVFLSKSYLFVRRRRTVFRCRCQMPRCRNPSVIVVRDWLSKCGICICSDPICHLALSRLCASWVRTGYNIPLQGIGLPINNTSVRVHKVACWIVRGILNVIPPVR